MSYSIIIQGHTGPIGHPGLTGNAGSSGVQGSVGLTGSTGPTGPTGRTGAVGITGSQGMPGTDGATGARGRTGLVGLNGSIGNVGAQGSTGFTGSEGLWGAQGALGPQGHTGPTGVTGSPGSIGVMGVTGSDGSMGDTGPRGSQGSPGSIGVTGAQGPAGSTGATGPRGETGPIGVVVGDEGALGSTGPTGDIGDSGVTGPAGANGEQGSSGQEGATGGTGARGATGTYSPNLEVAFATLSSPYSNINFSAGSIDGLAYITAMCMSSTAAVVSGVTGVAGSGINTLTWSPSYDKYIAYHANGAIESSDGVTWTSTNLLDSDFVQRTWKQLIWSDIDQMFLGVANPSSTFWTGIASSASDETHAGSVRNAGTYMFDYSNTYYISSNTALYISNSPIVGDWSSFTWNAIAYSPPLDMFWVLGNSQTSIPNGAYSSPTVAVPNGFPTRRLWTEVSSTPSGVWNSITWFDAISRFVAVGSNALIYTDNVDGRQWYSSGTEGGLTNPGNCCWTCIAYSSALRRVVVVGRANDGASIVPIRYSDDGVTWTDASSANSLIGSEWECVVWCEYMRVFVACARAGTSRIRYSFNGAEWFPLTSTTAALDTQTWKSIACSPTRSQFVVLANGSFTSDSVARIEYNNSRISLASNGIPMLSADFSNGLRLGSLGSFIKYIQWGRNTTSSTTQPYSVTFTDPGVGSPIVLVSVEINTSACQSADVYNISGTSFSYNLYLHNSSTSGKSGVAHTLHWIVIHV